MKRKKVIYTAIMITILIFSMGNMVFAKYYNNFNAIASSKMATPIIELSKEDNENKIITANSGVELILNVSNFNKEKISEVGQNYYLQFYSNDIDISKFNIIAKLGEKEVQIKDGITKTMYIQANKKETHKYNIQITSSSVENIKGTIKAKIISEQVKPN